MKTLPDDRYLVALERQRARVATGLPLRAVDSNTPGDKYTECTWGLCSGEREAWPDAQDHMWPDQFISRGRVAPEYRAEHQTCPLDKRERPVTSMQGCFYSCRIFQARPKSARPTREETVALYDVEISRVRANPRGRTPTP